MKWLGPQLDQLWLHLSTWPNFDYNRYNPTISSDHEINVHCCKFIVATFLPLPEGLRGYNLLSVGWYNESSSFIWYSVCYFGIYLIIKSIRNVWKIYSKTCTNTILRLTLLGLFVILPRRYKKQQSRLNKNRSVQKNQMINHTFYLIHNIALIIIVLNICIV